MGAATFFRKVALNNMHPYQLQIISGAVHIVFIPLWIYLLYKNGSLEFNVTGVYYALICCVIYTAATVLFSFSLRDSNSPGVISALICLNPVVTMILAYFFLDESITITKIIAFILALASALLLSL